MATATTARDRRSRRFAWILGALSLPVLFLIATNAFGSSSTDALPASTTTTAGQTTEAPTTTALSPTTTQPAVASSGEQNPSAPTTTTIPFIAASAPETTTTTATPTTTTVAPATTTTTTPTTTTSTTTTVPPTTTTTTVPTPTVTPTTTTQPPAPEPVLVTVQLVDHDGAGQAGGSASVGTAEAQGTTNEDGIAVLELLPGSHEVTMSLHGTTQSKEITVAEGMEPVVFATGRVTVAFTGSATLNTLPLTDGLEVLPGSYEVRLADSGIATADSLKTRRQAVTVSISVDAYEDVSKAAVYATLHNSFGEPTSEGAASALLVSTKAWEAMGSTNGSGAVAFLLDTPATAVRMKSPSGSESVLEQTSTDNSFYDFATSSATLELVDHVGASLPGGTAALKSGERWHNVGTTDRTGTVVFEAFGGEYAVSMTYNGTVEQRTGVDVHAKPVVFQTGRFTVLFSGDVTWGGDALKTYEGPQQVLPGTVQVGLGRADLPTVNTQIEIEAGVDATATGAYVVVLDANGDPVEGATTKLRIRGNPSLGSTNEKGVTAALLPGLVSGSRVVQADLNGTRARVRQNITTNSIYEFTALSGAIEVLSADGSPLVDVEVLQRTSKWLPVGTTDATGTVHIDVLAGTKRSYRVTHGGTTATRAHKFTTDNATLTFQKITGSVVVTNSAGTGAKGVEVLAKARKWESVGTTDTSGSVTFEVFPGTKRSHRVTMNGTTATKAHTFTETAPSVDFRTVAASVILVDSNGQPHVDVPVQQKAGKWRTIGSTDGSGTVSFEAFPTTKRNYRVTIGGTTAAKSHKFTETSGTLTFETILATVRVVTTAGDPLSDVPVEQKTKGWAPIGSTNDDGEVTLEVFAGKGRRYRAEVDGIVKERGKRFTKANGVLELRFRPPVVEAEENESEPSDDA